MSIVTDDMVEKALEYLGQDPHPIATARGDLTRAENDKKIIPARLWAVVPGSTIADKKAAAEAHPDYVNACEREQRAVRELEQARAKQQWANTAIEVWRSDQANARAAEKVR